MGEIFVCLMADPVGGSRECCWWVDPMAWRELYRRAGLQLSASACNSLQIWWNSRAAMSDGAAGGMSRKKHTLQPFEDALSLLSAQSFLS